jgi:Glycosyl transferase family 64 domain
MLEVITLGSFLFAGSDCIASSLSTSSQHKLFANAQHRNLVTTPCRAEPSDITLCYLSSFFLAMEENDAIATMQLTSRNRTTQATSPSSAASTTSPSPSPSPVAPLLYNKSSSPSSHDDGNHRYHKAARPNIISTKSVASTILVRIWHQWRLLKTPNKMATAIVAILLLEYFLLGVWDYTFRRVGVVTDNSNNNIPKSTEEDFAVVINTYQRPDMLRQAVQHYAGNCGTKYRVGQVFVVWAEQGVSVPSPESFFDEKSAIRKNNLSTRASVEVLQVSKDSLNSRFEPIPQLITTSVFMVDDDIRVACPDLLLGFQAWKENPDAMVGYYPRLSSPPMVRGKGASTAQSELVYHAWPIVFWRQEINFVLTKASFLHSKYLALYTNDDTFPKEIKDHVDKHMNCEDIAMSMLVANYTRYQSSLQQQPNKNEQPPLPARPIYVEGTVSDRGLFGGISTGSGHMTTRSDCLTQLTAIFESKGWGSPFDHTFDLGDSSYIHHAPGFWWQAKPSNIFEWMAFANTFT